MAVVILSGLLIRCVVLKLWFMSRTWCILNSRGEKKTGWLFSSQNLYFMICIWPLLANINQAVFGLAGAGFELS